MKNLNMKIGRANPSQWANYSTASPGIIQNEQRRYLYESYSTNSFQERRRPRILRYFDNSNTKVGAKSLRSWLTKPFNQINFEFYPFINLDRLCINLKKIFWWLGFSSLLVLLPNPDEWTFHDWKPYLFNELRLVSSSLSTNGMRVCPWAGHLHLLIKNPSFPHQCNQLV